MSKLLLVEDIEYQAEATAALLRPIASEISIVRTLKEALLKLRANGFRVMLLDLKLPDSLRHETIDQIASIKKEHGGKKLVIMSEAPATADEMQRCIDAGADLYIEKSSPNFAPLVCALVGAAG